MTIVEEVTKCNDCPFWGNSMDGMECRHPYFEKRAEERRFIHMIKDDGWDPYENMIINSGNVNGIPDKCPLRSGEVVTIVKLK
jgi:hypothetical protein